jgi:signal transduction histidine kinase
MTISLRSVHALTESVVQLLDLQKALTSISMLAIACSAGAIGFIVVTSNKRLEKTVGERTQQLKVTLETLDESNLKLKLQSELQKQFINTAAHELRTPVTPILVVASLDRKNDNGLSDTVTLPREQFDIIQRNAEKLKRLSDDILDTARIESKQLNLNLESFDIRSLISKVVQNARRRIEAGPNLNTNIDYVEVEVPLTVIADKTKIERVLDNLITNSLKFCSNGTITIDVSGSDGYEVVVSISDNGLGIDPDILDRLFSKFASNSTDGTGLGLFISKGIVEAHGGRIWARNNAPQKGATFSFALPSRNLKHS